MKVSLFDYELPPELVAQTPPETRGASRLLVLDRRDGRITHHPFARITRYLAPGDVMVLNDTRVIAARVWGLRRTMGRVEVLFVRRREDGLWEALVGSGGKVKLGEVLKLAGGAIEVRVVGKSDEGVFTLDVLCPDDLPAALEAHGHVPTPPYIDRRGERAALEKMDRDRYQTVYAKSPGAVAAPTAGLHFTDRLLARIRALGVEVVTVTLHVGLGTFRPVKTGNVEDHVMHGEYFEVGREAADALNSARRDRRRIIAVGTTTTRVLESLDEGEVRPRQGTAELFIYPPYSFRRVGAMLTNFHLPKSTLLMMVSALAGRERVLEAYREAIREGYRFYSYGDAMLIL